MEQAGQKVPTPSPYSTGVNGNVTGFSVSYAGTQPGTAIAPERLGQGPPHALRSRDYSA